jgi:hypothetical protein
MNDNRVITESKIPELIEACFKKKDHDENIKIPEGRLVLIG